MPTNPPRPTDAELSILRVLWQRGPSTVRQIQEELNRVQPTGYTTVLKFLQIMSDKGLVDRDVLGHLELLGVGEREGELLPVEGFLPSAGIVVVTAGGEDEHGEDEQGGETRAKCEHGHTLP